MKKLFVTIKYGFISSFKSEKSKGTYVFWVLFGILWFILFSIIAVTNYSVYKLGNTDEYFIMLLTQIFISMFYCVMQNIYRAPGILFKAKDFDMLSSFPLKDSDIVSSKLMIMYLSNLLFNVVFGLSALIPYGMITNKNFVFYIMCLIFILSLTFLTVTIGSLSAYIFGKLSSKFKISNTIMTVLTIILLLFLLSFGKNSNSIFLNTDFFQDGLQNNYLISTLLSIFEQQNIISLIIICTICIVPFAIFVMFFARDFKKINNSFNEYFRMNNYKIKKLNLSKPLYSIIKKDLKIFFNSSSYVINSFFGMIIMSFITISLVASKDGGFLSQEKELLELIFNSRDIGFAIIIAVTVMLCNINSSTISIEGQKLWILKTLPADTFTILHSKIISCFIIMAPLGVINIIIYSVFTKSSIIVFLQYVLYLILMILLSAQLYLYINLCLPKFDWTTEMQVVKQSLSVFVSLAVGFVIIFLVFGLFFMFDKMTSYPVFLMSVMLFLSNTIIFFVLKKDGVAKFSQL